MDLQELELFLLLVFPLKLSNKAENIIIQYSCNVRNLSYYNKKNVAAVTLF